MDYLTKENIDFARYVAYKVGRRDEMDDHVSDAYYGLVKAARDFDPAYGAEFRTFAYQKIRGEIQEGVRKRKHWFTWTGHAIGAVAREPLEDGSYLPDTEDMLAMLSLYNSLNVREQDILRMRLHGYDNYAIAAKHHVHPKTVYKTYRKLYSTIT